MNQENEQQRQERKDMFISLVLSKSKGMGDTIKLYKEAEEMFEKANPLLIDSMIKLYGKSI